MVSSLVMVSSTDIQRNPGRALRRRTPVIVTQRGKPAQLQIPMPSDAKRARALVQYIEAWFEGQEMESNRKALAARYRRSKASGLGKRKI